MKVPAQRGPDGFLRVVCPREECGKRIKLRALPKAKWITCPQLGCGQRFEVYLPGAQPLPGNPVAPKPVKTTEGIQSSVPAAKAPLPQAVEKTIPMRWLLAGGGLAVVVLLILASIVLILMLPRKPLETPIQVAEASPKAVPTPGETNSGKSPPPIKIEPPAKVNVPAKIEPPAKVDVPAKTEPPAKIDPPKKADPSESIVGEAKQIRLDVKNVTAMAFSPDGRHVAVGTREGGVILSELNTGKTRQLLPGGDKYLINCLAFSANGNKLASGCSSPLGQPAPVRIWNVADGSAVATLNHGADVTGVAFSPDGKRAVSSSLDTSVRLWDLENASEIRWLGPETKRFEQRYGFACVAFSPDGKQVLTGDHSVAILVSGGRATISSSVGSMAMRVWDAGTGKAVCRSPQGKIGAKLGHQEWITAAAYEREGRWAVTASADTTLRKWDSQTGAEQRVFQGHSGDIRCLALSPDGRYLLSGGGKVMEAGKYTDRIDSTVRLWEIETGKEIHKFDGHEKEVLQVAFLPDGKQAVSGSADGTVRIWNLPKQLATSKVPEVANTPEPTAPKKGDLVQKLVGTWVAKDGSGLQVTFNDAPAIILKTKQAIQGVFYDLKGEDTLEFTGRLGAGFGQRVRASFNDPGDELRIVLDSGDTISFRKTK